MSDKLPTESTKPIEDKTSGHVMSAKHFVSPGILLFFDQLLIAIGGWAFWIVVSKFTPASAIGEATTIFSLVMVVTLITQLGLEYPLLRRASTSRTQILGTGLAVTLILSLASLPFMIYVMTEVYGYPLWHEFIWIAMASVLFGAAGFVAKFALLGLSDARNVLLFEGVGTAVKFVAGYVLISNGYGSLGILLSFLFFTMVVCLATLAIAVKSFPLRIESRKFVKQFAKEGLWNTPSKISRMLVLNLSVVLLASVGIASSSDVGIFYIATMMSITAAGFASSLAFMMIPASSSLKKDLSIGSLRIGLGLTVPIITVILVSPASILSLISKEYETANEILFVLGLGIVPYIIGINAISHFNNREKSRAIILMGTVQLAIFLASFFVLVPQHSTLGAAYSVVISFTASAILSFLWTERIFLKYIFFCLIAIGAGFGIGYIMVNIVNVQVLGIPLSLATSFTIILVSKTVSVAELRQIMKTVLPSHR